MLKSLIHEMHRRSLWQVLVIYLGASWLVLQAVDTLAGALSLPEWAPPLALFLLIVGFPIVLATAFVQEGMGGQGAAKPPDAAGKEATAAAEESTSEAPAEHARVAEPAASVTTSQDRAVDIATHHKLLTWRNALIGALAALALLGALTIGYMVMRTMGIGPAATLVARGVLEERATIILAEFDSRTGDSLLAGAATEAFRIDLSQSDAVRVAEPSSIADALRRMERSPHEVLDYDLASEIAQREGFAAIVDGDINSAGGTYLLATRLTAADTGEELAAFRETAKDSSQIVPALDRLSKKLRERIGDSYKSLRSDEPLEGVTTGNLEALRKYSQAVRALEVGGNPQRAITLLEEAVRLDPEFAMAWRKLGVQLGNQGDSRKRQVEALSMAFEHRDRLTERERYLTMGSYYTTVTGETDKAISAYQNILDTNPDDTWALNNLGILYSRLRDFERSLQLYNRATAADSGTSFHQQNTISALIALGRLDEAERERQVFASRFPTNPTNYFLEANLAAVRRDFGESEAVYRRAVEGSRGIPTLQAGAEFGLYGILTTQGRLAEAGEHLERATALQEGRGVPAARLNAEIGEAFVDLTVRRDTATARSRVAAALQADPLSSISPLERPYFQLAGAYALAGEPARARELWDEYQQAVPPELRGDDEVQRHAVPGLIAYAEGRYDEAVDEFRRADVGECLTCVLYALGQAFERAGQPDSALATYERYLDATNVVQPFTDPGSLAAILERLGEMYDERENWEKAAEYYARFVELWQDADPELRPRVEAAQTRLDEIFAQRG
ncbi:MAG: tetratricopeptide repeat protein [Gemmatimonadales bacterium]|jgi:tetratricopeptide (TPR) repeat protein